MAQVIRAVPFVIAFGYCSVSRRSSVQWPERTGASEFGALYQLKQVKMWSDNTDKGGSKAVGDRA